MEYKVKQVILFRKDLNMRKGKIAAQVAHASMKVFFDRAAISNNIMMIALTQEMSAWSKGSFAKIVLSVETEADLLRAYELAQTAGLPCALITDAGNTEFAGVPTHTAVAIGPAACDEIDKITGPNGLVPTKLA